MSLKPHPETSMACRAQLTVRVIRWQDGRRRADLVYSRTLYCDEWVGHDVHLGTPHCCHVTGEPWFVRPGDASYGAA